ncbi:MAG: hypothetical protein HKO78_05735 [Acidimicrobiia bacterium]|nr:hypothetical protein [Acidimicrobiia bacterium]
MVDVGAPLVDVTVVEVVVESSSTVGTELVVTASALVDEVPLSAGGEVIVLVVPVGSLVDGSVVVDDSPHPKRTVARISTPTMRTATLACSM